MASSSMAPTLARLTAPTSVVARRVGSPQDVRVSTEGAGPAFELSPESTGEASGRGRMVGRRVVVVGAGQTDYGHPDQPVDGGVISCCCSPAKAPGSSPSTPTPRPPTPRSSSSRQQAGTLLWRPADVAEPGDVDAMVDACRRLAGGHRRCSRYNVGVPGVAGFEGVDAGGLGQHLRREPAGSHAHDARRVAGDGTRVGGRVHVVDRRVWPTGRIVAYESSKAGLAALMRCGGVRRQGEGDPGQHRDAGPHRHRDRPQRQRHRRRVNHPGAARPPRHRVGGRVRGAVPPSHESAYVTGQVLAVDGGRTSL